LDALQDLSVNPERLRIGLELTGIDVEVLRLAFKGLPTYRNVVQTIKRKLIWWMEKHPDHEVTKRYCDLIPPAQKKCLPPTWEEL
jgi:hypothetical protein